MSKRLYEIVEIKDLKDMLNKTKVLYGNRVAFKVAEGEDKYREIKDKSKEIEEEFKEIEEESEKTRGFKGK